jgi:DNA polymerase I-like protein with 3'-5' exonuclease and polymerase domains
MNLFDDIFLVPRKESVLRKPPPVPHTGWTCPRDFPNLSNAVVIGLDTETKELDFEHGPGWSRGQGHIIGFSLSAIDNYGNEGKWYFPVRHEYMPEQNHPYPQQCFNWLRDVLNSPYVPKVGANLIYDLGWLTEENIFVQGELHDVQFAESLLVNDAVTNLDYLGGKYFNQGKETDLVYQWCAEAYGGNVNGKQRSNLWRAPPALVGPYAESDAMLPLRVFEKQRPLLLNEGLWEVYRLECDNIPLIIEMRRQGVRIDVSAAERMFTEVQLLIEQGEADLTALAGKPIKASNPTEIGELLTKFGIKVPLTQTTKKYSVTKPFLKALTHPIGKKINEVRTLTKLRDTFVKGYLLERNVNGIIHGSFNPLKGDEDGGADSGRFSSSNPNLQNIPSRSDLGKKLRSCFIPDDGHDCWQKSDQSQVEYRMLVHDAVSMDANGNDTRADEVRAQFNAEPNTDYHKLTQALVKRESGVYIPRNADECTAETGTLTIKEINFGLLYGMGEGKMAKTAGFSKEKSKLVFAAYHSGNPYVKATMDYYSKMVQEVGYVPTLLGRRTRFDLWEPIDIDYMNRAIPLPYMDAIRQYGPRIQRSDAHKGINRRLQGGAADQMKVAMRDLWKSGVIHVIGVPKLTVHDELDWSVKDRSREQNEAYKEADRIMKECVPLRIPLKVDTKRGPNWGAIG